MIQEETRQSRVSNLEKVAATQKGSLLGRGSWPTLVGLMVGRAGRRERQVKPICVFFSFEHCLFDAGRGLRVG